MLDSIKKNLLFSIADIDSIPASLDDLVPEVSFNVEDIAEENNCRIERKEWKSKYNSYVVYDYEPFCSEGFEINILLSSFEMPYLNFIK